MSEQQKDNYGMLTEQGDLGLGFFALNESEKDEPKEETKDKK